jgi:predicted HNH restriction endonuclease
MQYLFQRVVRNDCGWKKPSRGRLQFTGDGGYLESTGFGHEDWNFSLDKCADGHVHAYLYYRPKDPSDVFNILFATFGSSEGWALCGFFENATFHEKGAVFPPEVIRRRAEQLKELDDANSLGGAYRRKSVKEISARLRKEAEHYRWRVKPRDVHYMQVPLPVPKELTTRSGKRFGAYFATPTMLSKSEWDALLEYSADATDKPRQDDYGDGGDVEFPEGKEYERKHLARERNRQLVIQAKSRFKSKHGCLYCEVCDFDFQATYGSAGEDFIEVHHTIPVCELPPGAKTNIADVALVCSNCHRMLHRRRPWLTIPKLRKLIKRAR